MNISKERLAELSHMNEHDLLHEAHTQGLEFTQCLVKEVTRQFTEVDLSGIDFSKCTTIDSAIMIVPKEFKLRENFLRRCVIAWESNENAQAQGAESRFKTPEHIRSGSAVGIAILTQILSA